MTVPPCPLCVFLRASSCEHHRAAACFVAGRALKAPVFCPKHDELVRSCRAFLEAGDPTAAEKPS